MKNVWDSFGELYRKVTKQELDYSTFNEPIITDAKENLIMKAVIPNFLFKPPFGYPISKDIPELRRLAKVPYAKMIIKTTCDEVASLEWNIKGIEDEEIPDEILKKTRRWFYNPNRNNESWEYILRTWVKDILEIDAGVLVKVFNLKGELTEVYTRDGGAFTKNPDIFGVLPDENAYYQYGWNVARRPQPFNKNEIIYAMQNPSADSIYGYSNIEALQATLQLLLYGVDSNLEYFSNNMIPKGVLFIKNANDSQIKAFKKQFKERIMTKDSAGNWRKKFHEMPILNTEGKFEKLGFSNLDMELLKQQEWFMKIVFACFGITPSEMGFTEDSNKATDEVQNIIQKRKGIKPLIQLLEYHINTQLINDLPWIKGTQYEDKIEFFFDKADLQEETKKRAIIWGDYEKGLISVNEARVEMGLEPIEEENADKLDKFVEQEEFDEEDNWNNDEADEKTEEDLDREDDDRFSKKKSLKALPKKIEIDFKKVKWKTLKNTIESTLSEQEKLLLKELKKKTTDKLSDIKSVERKGIIDYLLGLFSLDALKPVVKEQIKKNYFTGMDIVEAKLDRNFIYPKEMEFIETYTFDLVKNLGDETREKLRTTIQRGMLDKNSYKELATDIRKVFDISKARSEAIAITETNRAVNSGAYEAIVQSGYDGWIEWNAVMDGRTSGICKYLDGKKVRVGDKFTYKGESWLHSPAHVNCRSSFSFLPD